MEEGQQRFCSVEKYLFKKRRKGNLFVKIRMKGVNNTRVCFKLDTIGTKKFSYFSIMVIR